MTKSTVKYMIAIKAISTSTFMKGGDLNKYRTDKYVEPPMMIAARMIRNICRVLIFMMHKLQGKCNKNKGGSPTFCYVYKPPLTLIVCPVM